MTHEFLFSPAQWIGEGKITFAASTEHLRFFTKWVIAPLTHERIVCHQQVEIRGGAGSVSNQLTISKIGDGKFCTELTTDQMESVPGTGIFDAKTIAWEFRGLPDFEGFEAYELQENGDYMFHAEYITLSHMRTIIDGRIWKK